MLQSLFSAPIWLWVAMTALAVTLPLLIHLINFLRYRRVKWAAMEFLLKSHRRKQKKILLTQVLLIVSRIALLLVAILLFGHVGCRSDQGNHFGDGMLHVVILDDSYSMGEIQASGTGHEVENLQGSGAGLNGEHFKSTCFENAQKAILELARKLTKHPNQKLQILRTSWTLEENRKLVWDCDSNLIRELELHFSSAGVSDDASGIARLKNQNQCEEILKEDCLVYLFSDTRVRDFENDLARSILGEIRSKSKRFTLIDCNHRQAEPMNLLINRFEPEHDFLAAGVPFYLTLEVQNRSKVTQRNIEVEIRRAFAKRDSSNEIVVENDPPAFIPKLDPGKKAILQIPVMVPTSGRILFEAELPTDGLPADNVFHRILDAHPFNKILLISDRQDQPSQYLRWVFEPKLAGSQAISGIQVSQVSSAAFRESSAPDFSGIKVIFLLSDDLANNAMIKKLEEFVSTGGLLFLCPGKSTDTSTLNKVLYKNGKGMIPFPLDSAVELPDRPTGTDSDIQFISESIGKYFTGESQKLLSLVRVEKKFIPPRDWQPGPHQQILATIRGRATTPLITQSKFGAGNVITILSPFDDEWNNWPKNPTFLVLLYRLIYQSLTFESKNDLAVGVPAKPMLKQIETDQSSRLWHQRNLKSLPFQLPVPENNGETWTPRKKGIYFIDKQSNNMIAAKLDLNESDLSSLNQEKLLDLMRLPEVEIVAWNELALDELETQSDSTKWLLILLVGLLVVEQWFALRSGFHRSNRQQGPPLQIRGGRRV